MPQTGQHRTCPPPGAEISGLRWVARSATACLVAEFSAALFLRHGEAELLGPVPQPTLLGSCLQCRLVSLE